MKRRGRVWEEVREGKGERDCIKLEVRRSRRRWRNDDTSTLGIDYRVVCILFAKSVQLLRIVVQ